MVGRKKKSTVMRKSVSPAFSRAYEVSANPKMGGYRKKSVDRGDSKLIRFQAWARSKGVKVTSDRGRGAAKVSTIKKRASRMGIPIPAEYMSWG